MNLSNRRTFAIISHPDAGKTTVTEKLLFLSGSIQLAGAIKAKKATRHATSDWMKMEQERGISVSTSVMQFEHQDHVFNLLDTPGHHDFSEDTYRTLTAVDSGLMIIDAAKGVETRTKKLMEIVAMRKYPVITFINKLDRDAKDPLVLIDEIESTLNIQCAPVTLPIGCGKNFLGVYHLQSDQIERFEKNSKDDSGFIQGLESKKAKDLLGQSMAEFKELLEMIKGLTKPLNMKLCHQGKQSPVFFGSAINHFGVHSLLGGIKQYAICPPVYQAKEKQVHPTQKQVSGFVFKIQANMDPKHRDRMAFMRIVSGEFQSGMSLKQSRTGKLFKMNHVHRFMAGKREAVETAYPGDILGIYNHGQICIGDSFSEKEILNFVGIPHFSPELFKRIKLNDPMKNKQLQKGLDQLSEEGATQVFRISASGETLIGAVGALQFDVVAYRLQNEYQVDCVFESTAYRLARWIEGSKKTLDDFIQKYALQTSYDSDQSPVFLATSAVNLSLTEKRYPDIIFSDSKEVIK